MVSPLRRVRYSLICVAVVKHCPRLCRRGCDYGIVVERELAQFLRGLMRFIYPVTSIPAEYENAALL